MDGITDKDVEGYLYNILPPRDGVLAEMEARARERRIPIIGPAVGRVLFQYARLLGARRVFELGSAIGYSTIWLARAVGEGGRVYYTDGDAANADEARGWFERAGVASRVEVLVGDAIESLARTEGTFDLIFDDVDKHQYPASFKAAVPRLRSGGLFVADNALWGGSVAHAAENDPDTAGVRELNRLAYATNGLFATILPLRDGVLVCRKE